MHKIKYSGLHDRGIWSPLSLGLPQRCTCRGVLVVAMFEFQKHLHSHSLFGELARVYNSLSLSIYIYIYICLYISIYLYIYLSLSLSLCIYIYIYIRIYIYIYTYVLREKGQDGRAGVASDDGDVDLVLLYAIVVC